MKSEHRHELKTNDLAKGLLTFQDYVRVYGGRVALGLAIVVLAIVLLVQRSSKARTRAVEIENNLAYARGQVDRLAHHNARPGDMGQVRKMLQEIRDETSDKHVAAQALVAQGDLAWAIANYLDTSDATTQPAPKPEKSPEESLKEAKDAYQQVLDQYADQPIAAIAAHFGLAAVAENQANWDDAQRHYDVVNRMGDAPQQFKLLAESKLKRLDDIRKPILVGAVPEKFEPPVPPTPPTPASVPTTGAATQATTKPAVSTTGLTKTGLHGAFTPATSKPTTAPATKAAK